MISHLVTINVVEFRSRDADSWSRGNNNRNTQSWHGFPLARIFAAPNDRHFLPSRNANLTRKKSGNREFLHKLSRMNARQTRLNPPRPFDKKKTKLKKSGVISSKSWQSAVTKRSHDSLFYDCSNDAELLTRTFSVVSFALRVKQRLTSFPI